MARKALLLQLQGIRNAHIRRSGAYRTAVVFHDLARDVALKMVDPIERYAALSVREVRNQIM